MTRERILATFVVVAPALAVIAGIALWLNGIGPSETDLIMLAVGSLATMAGVELGYHRYFAHRAFTAHPALAWLLGALGSSAFLGPVMWWATMHRRHHSLTDREGDPHSPHWPYNGSRGLVHAHAGWLFRPEYTSMTVTAGEVKDLWQSSRTIAIHRSYLTWAVLGLVIPALIGLAAGGLQGALTGFLWGGMVRVFLVSHIIWAVNSFGHLRGERARLRAPDRRATAYGWPCRLWVAVTTPTTTTRHGCTPPGCGGGRSTPAPRCSGRWPCSD